MTRESSAPGVIKRIGYGALAVALIVLGFLFLTAALLTATVIATAVAARRWWISRRLRQQSADEVLEGEYRTINRRELPRDPGQDSP